MSVCPHFSPVPLAAWGPKVTPPLPPVKGLQSIREVLRRMPPAPGVCVCHQVGGQTGWGAASTPRRTRAAVLGWGKQLSQPIPGSPGLCRLPQSSHGTSLVAQMVKNLPTVQETWAQSLGGEDPLEKEMATHSRILAWGIPWTEKPAGLQSMGSQRVAHD